MGEKRKRRRGVRRQSLRNHPKSLLSELFHGLGGGVCWVVVGLGRCPQLNLDFLDADPQRGVPLPAGPGSTTTSPMFNGRASSRNNSLLWTELWVEPTSTKTAWLSTSRNSQCRSLTLSARTTKSLLLCLPTFKGEASDDDVFPVTEGDELLARYRAGRGSHWQQILPSQVPPFPEEAIP